MRFWCLLLALGLIQLATFSHEVEAFGGRDTDGDGLSDDGKTRPFDEGHLRI